MSFARLWLPPALWMCGIFWFSSVPGQDLPRLGILHADKAVHLAEFCVFGALLARAYMRSRPVPARLGHVVVPACLAALYAAFDEWHQRFIPGRTVDPVDFLCNVAGGLAGAWLYYVFFTRKGVPRGIDPTV